MSRLVQVVRTLARRTPCHGLSTDIARSRIFRSAYVGNRPDSWDTRILRLADGRTVAEVVTSKFLEEASSGAWAVDIGTWRGIFAVQVGRSVDQLARSGHLRLDSPADQSCLASSLTV